MKLIVDIIGWIGSILVVAAYGLNSYQKIKSDSLSFLLMNLVGAISLIIYGYYYSAFANIFINVVWVIIAVPGLIKFYSKSKAKAI